MVNNKSRKHLISLSFIICSLFFSVSAYSRPAWSGTNRVQQPDGTFVTVRLVGDEYLSFTTTSDGYSVVKDNRGYYVYATKDDDGHLSPTTLVAHDAEERSAVDIAYLEAVGKMLTPVMSSQMSEMRRQNKAARSKQLAARRAAQYDYDNFKGLVILVEYNDCDFTHSDYHDIMDDMLNKDDYTGDSRTNVTAWGTTYKCTGSVRDYFRDNSTGQFIPTFDVAGPVKINRSKYYPLPQGKNGPNNYQQLMIDACTAADDIVNFKDYDVDKDGVVDMIYFIFAGEGSFVEGNDERLLWPHQSDLTYSHKRFDNVYLGRYACSTEILYQGILEGIGTITHEFSHVLGLPDLYDTGNMYPSGYCVTPEEWSVMANGADYNYGRTPCNYSLFERYALGFATPEVLDQAGHYSIDAIHTSNSGYRLNTPEKKEYFLLENRQKKKWDSQLPGHGMLIFRVDSTSSQAWYYNAVNDNPDHPYYQLVRAKGGKSSTAKDPFPGSARVTTIDNQTTPANLKTWSGKKSALGLKNITESNGVISFDAFDVDNVSSVSLPDAITMPVGNTLQLTPVIEPDYVSATFTWTSSNTSVASVDGNGVVTANAVGDALITVTANGGPTASCLVTVEELQTVADIASFKSLEEGEERLLLLNDAQVLMVYSNTIYVRDASGCIVIKGTGLSVKNNDVLNGSIYGQLSYNNRMPTLVSVAGKTNPNSVISTSGSPAEEHEVTVALLTDDNLADKIVVRGVRLTEINKKWYVVDGNQKAWIYNTFKLKNLATFSSYEDRYFDIHAILTTSVVDNDVTYVLSFTDSMVEVSKPAPKEGDVNEDGKVDVADIASILSIMAGVSSDFDGDVNKDGKVDVADIATVLSIMAQL